VVAVPLRPAPLLLVGQAPGPREEGRGRLFAHTAGQRLFAWFAAHGADEATFRERVYLAAVTRCFPGRDGKGDRVPSPVEIARCAPHLERELALVAPRTVIALGRLAIGWFLGPRPLDEVVGEIFPLTRAGVSFTLVPLPHPSGRSTWAQRPERRARLERALARLARTAGWRAAFRS